MSVYGSYSGVSTGRPLTLEEKGVLIAASSLAFPFVSTGGRIGLTAWKLRPLMFPFLLSPGGGGPGHTLTSTDILLDSEGWSNPLLRGYRPSHGY